MPVESMNVRAAASTTTRPVPTRRTRSSTLRSSGAAARSSSPESVTTTKPSPVRRSASNPPGMWCLCCRPDETPNSGERAAGKNLSDKTDAPVATGQHEGRPATDDRTSLMATEPARSASVLAGRIEQSVVDWPALRGNPLGDPSSRQVYVYLPPGYDTEPDRRYPSIYMIQGYTGQVDMWWNRSAYRTPFPIAADQ